jgi:hypothetical protein
MMVLKVSTMMAMKIFMILHCLTSTLEACITPNSIIMLRETSGESANSSVTPIRCVLSITHLLGLTLTMPALYGVHTTVHIDRIEATALTRDKILRSTVHWDCLTSSSFVFILI